MTSTRLVDLPAQRVQGEPAYLRHVRGAAREVERDLTHPLDREVLGLPVALLDAGEIPVDVLEPHRAWVHDARRALVAEPEQGTQPDGAEGQGQRVPAVIGEDLGVQDRISVMSSRLDRITARCRAAS